MQRTYNVRTKPGSGFGALHLLNKVLGQHAAHAIKAYDQEDPAGYTMTAHFKAPSIPKHSADDRELAHGAITAFNDTVRTRREKYGHTDGHPVISSIHDLPTNTKAYAIPGIPKTVKGAKNPDAYLPWDSAAARKTVKDVQSAVTRLAPAHSAMAQVASQYGGEAVPHKALAPGIAPTPAEGVHAHVKPGVHAASFHFKSKADAWRAMTALKAGGHHVTDVASHDSKGSEVLNLLTKSTKRPFESVEHDKPGDKFDVEGKDLVGRFDGLPVFLVAGAEVRSHLVDFALGGNPCAYSRMPDEIWVERTSDTFDQGMVLLHELLEYVAMKYGDQAYDKAHHLANDAEALVRQIAGQKEAVAESLLESVKGGAFRDHAGRFSAVSKPGGGEWVPEIPADFKAVVEQLGGKVKRSGNGGGMACVFKTVEAAKAAHAKLAEQGHRVNPHDIPGVLLVSFVNRRFTGLHEAKLPHRIDGNPNQRDTLDIARQLGASVEDVHRTGEVRVHHPEWDSGVTINSRRKDTPRELVKRLNQLLKNRRQDEAVATLEDFHVVKGDQAQADQEAQTMADRINADVAVVKCEEDDDFLIVPMAQWMGPEDSPDDEGHTLVSVFAPEGDSTMEAVAKRHSLAARLSAGRIRGRPMGGRRLRVAMKAKAWRRANPGKTKRKRMHTVYRDSSSIHPLKKNL